MRGSVEAHPPNDPAPAERDSTHDPDLRRALLLALGILDTGPEPAFDGLTRVAASVTGCPAAVLSLAVGDRLWAKSCYGTLAQTLLQECAHHHGGLLDPDWVELSDPVPGLRLSQGLAAGPALRYYAGLPVRVEGVSVGVLCVMDTVPRTAMGAAARQSLEALATAVEALLASRRPGADGEARALSRRQALLSRVSHEMRTPLNALQGFAQLLRLETQSGGNPRAANWVQQIEKASAHLLALVEEMLDLARLQEGSVLAPQRMDLPGALRDCVEMLGPAAAAHQVQLVLPPADTDTDWGVLADEHALRRLLLNLVGNAIQHSQPGSDVDLRLQADERMRGFSVNDPGPELSASRDLARSLHGRIEVQPSAGAGCTVTLQLPAAA